MHGHGCLIATPWLTLQLLDCFASTFELTNLLPVFNKEKRNKSHGEVTIHDDS